ncbi:MAG: hypothetical protein PUF78_00855 [Lachnospiraceae bacterium]|nr:hypothetical protein [Lachnospiraceae bacterium]
MQKNKKEKSSKQRCRNRKKKKESLSQTRKKKKESLLQIRKKKKDQDHIPGKRKRIKISDQEKK